MAAGVYLFADSYNVWRMSIRLFNNQLYLIFIYTVLVFIQANYQIFVVRLGRIVNAAK